jgi:hypothetical protein
VPIDPDNHPSAPPTPQDNERVVIELAIRVMQLKGWIEEPDDDLIETLKRLYDANPLCQVEVNFTGDPLCDMLACRPGEYLAAAYENDCNERWEREEAERWSCPCGFTFGLYPWSEQNVAFYTLTDSGLFDTQVNDCPGCSRNLKKTRADHANGQLGFAF